MYHRNEVLGIFFLMLRQQVKKKKNKNVAKNSWRPSGTPRFTKECQSHARVLFSHDFGDTLTSKIGRMTAKYYFIYFSDLRFVFRVI